MKSKKKNVYKRFFHMSLINIKKQKKQIEDAKWACLMTSSLSDTTTTTNPRPKTKRKNGIKKTESSRKKLTTL